MLKGTLTTIFMHLHTYVVLVFVEDRTTIKYEVGHIELF